MSQPSMIEAEELSIRVEDSVPQMSEDGGSKSIHRTPSRNKDTSILAEI